MLNAPESNVFEPELTGNSQIRDALDMYKQQKLIAWMYSEYCSITRNLKVPTQNLRLSKNEFLTFLKAFNDQVTDSQMNEIFQYYIRQ